MSGGYQNQNQNQAPQQPATALIEYRLRLLADRLPECRKDPSFQINVNQKNEVVVSCNTGIFGADGKMVAITAKVSAFEFGMMVLYAEQIHTKEPGFQFPLVRCYGPRKRQPGQQGPARGIDAGILVGKDANGVAYISLVRKDPPHIKFNFRPGNMADLVDAKTNQPCPLAEISNYYSQAWAKVLSPLVTYVLSTKVYDFREDANNNSGGNNNYQQNNNGGGNYQQPQNNNNGYQNGQQQAPVAPAPAPANDTGWDLDIPM
jgi:hypothetical protein